MQDYRTAKKLFIETDGLKGNLSAPENAFADAGDGITRF